MMSCSRCTHFSRCAATRFSKRGPSLASHRASRHWCRCRSCRPASCRVRGRSEQGKSVAYIAGFAVVSTSHASAFPLRILDLPSHIQLTSMVMMSKTAAVAELKAHLSRFLRRVKAGEEILITERDVPVARIVPVRAMADERVRALERQGLVRLGTGKLPKDFWRRPRGADAKGLVRAAVAEEREGGW